MQPFSRRAVQLKRLFLGRASPQCNSALVDHNLRPKPLPVGYDALIAAGIILPHASVSVVLRPVGDPQIRPPIVQCVIWVDVLTFPLVALRQPQN
jgi:hypothetical protein